MKKKIFTGLFVLLFSAVANAIDAFVIDGIEIEGLQRVSAGAVFVALPVKAGDEMNNDVSAASIQAIYATGLFDDVQLRRDGDTLIVSVIERPLIADTTFSGNRKIKKEAFEGALQLAGMNAGGIYNPEELDKFVDELKQEYAKVGYFSVVVETSVVPVERNRVELFFKIYEGRVALIKEIRIIGNEHLSNEEVLDLMKVTTKKTWGLFNRNNRYNREVLRADIEKIISHYNNAGFINFNVDSLHSFISDDHRSILIVLSVSEGVQYEFGELMVSATEPVVPQNTLDSLVVEQPGDPYSFDAVGETRSSITDEFANRGYARTQVDPLPTVDDDKQSIDVNYVVDPGKLTYVRKIIFNGNYLTDDEVLRREMRIYEGSAYSAEKIKQSRARLNRLGIFQNIDIQIVDVADTDDQVDLIVEVEESLTGSVLFGVGYSESEDASFNIQFSQRNLYGTGKELTVNADYGKISKTLDIDYLNPYHTLDGVSRGLSLGYSKTDTSEANNRSIYNYDSISGSVYYGFPVSEISRVGLRLEGESFTFKDSTGVASDFVIRKFTADTKKGSNAVVTLSYRRDTRNRAVFASEGSDLYLASEFTGGELDFYTLRARYAHFFPLGEDVTLRIGNQIDYGSPKLPFYRNFYMTGSTQVRGFESGRFGAKEVCETTTNNVKSYSECSLALSLGGNLRVFTRADLYLPFLGTRDSDDKRFSFFVDAGNTFMTSNSGYSKEIKRASRISPELSDHLERPKFGNLRASSGLAFEWLSPIGPFGISYGIPIKEKEGDKHNKFQITLGYLN